MAELLRHLYPAFSFRLIQSGVAQNARVMTLFHGCCWNTLYFFVGCGLVVEIPTELLKCFFFFFSFFFFFFKFFWLLPKPNVNQYFLKGQKERRQVSPIRPTQSAKPQVGGVHLDNEERVRESLTRRAETGLRRVGRPGRNSSRPGGKRKTPLLIPSKT